MSMADFFDMFGLKSKGAEPVAKEKNTVQDWIPICDIYDKYALRRDGKLIGMLKVHPIDLSLMSEKEKIRIVHAFKEAVNSEKEPFEIFTIPRPVDLETYLLELNGMVAETGNPKRRLVLRDSIEFAVKMATTGSCVERQYYMIFTQSKGAKAEEDLINRMNELKMKLQVASIRTEICNDMDIMNVCALFAMPQTASVMPKRHEISFIPMFDEGE